MTTQIVLVEGQDRRGNLLLRQRVVLTAAKSTFTIGRGPEADVILDDADLAPQHVSLTIGPDGQLVATDLGAPQGIQVNGTRYRGDSNIALPKGELHIGATRIRAVLLRDDAKTTVLPPSPSRWPLLIAIGGGLTMLATTSYDTWAGSPADLPVALLTRIGLLAIFALVWIGIWAAVSRRNFGNSRWTIHGAIFVATTVIAEFAGKLALLAAFALSMPLLAKLNGWVIQVGIGTCIAVFLHLRFAKHWEPRTRLLVAFGIPLVLGLTTAWMMSRWQRTDVTSMDADLRLFPPTYRLTTATTTKAFFEDAAKLRAEAKLKLGQVPKQLLDRIDDADGEVE